MQCLVDIIVSIWLRNESKQNDGDDVVVALIVAEIWMSTKDADNDLVKLLSTQLLHLAF